MYVFNIGYQGLVGWLPWKWAGLVLEVLKLNEKRQVDKRQKEGLTKPYECRRFKFWPSNKQTWHMPEFWPVAIFYISLICTCSFWPPAFFLAVSLTEMLTAHAYSFGFNYLQYCLKSTGGARRRVLALLLKQGGARIQFIFLWGAAFNTMGLQPSPLTHVMISRSYMGLSVPWVLVTGLSSAVRPAQLERVVQIKRGQSFLK